MIDDAFETIDPRELLKDHVVLHTGSVERFHAYMASMAGPIERKIKGGSDIDLELRRFRLVLTEIALYSGNVDVTAETTRPVSSSYWIQFPLYGHFLAELLDRSIRVRPGHGIVFSPTQHLRRTQRPGSTIAVVIPAALMYSRAEQRSGKPLDNCLIFEPEIEPQRTRRFLELLLLIVDGIDRGRICTSEPLALILENAFVDLLLEMQPLQEGLYLCRSEAQNRFDRVRSVIEYVDSHLDEPLTVHSLATVAGCSTRELQTTFSKLCRITMLGAVRQRRLMAARQLLESAQIGMNVSDVALACGYEQFGRFSTDYRAAYGESPSETLGRIHRHAFSGVVES